MCAGLGLGGRGVSSKSSASASSSESNVSEPSSSTGVYKVLLPGFDPGTLSLRERAKGRCIACIEDANRSADKRCECVEDSRKRNPSTLCRLIFLAVT